MSINNSFKAFKNGIIKIGHWGKKNGRSKNNWQNSAPLEPNECNFKNPLILKTKRKKIKATADRGGRGEQQPFEFFKMGIWNDKILIQEYDGKMEI